MAAKASCGLGYETLVATIPLVMDFLDLDSEDIVASGILNDERLDDAVIAMILGHEKVRNGKQNVTASMPTTGADSETETGVETESSKESKFDQKPCPGILSTSGLSIVGIDHFKAHFRVSESTFDALMQDLLKPELTSFSKKKTVETGSISPVVKLMLTLQFLGCRLPMNQLAAAADISEAVYRDVVHETLAALNELLPHYIRWPDDSQVMQICDQFKKRSGLQGVLGTIDVLHVPVKAPAEYTDFYTNQQNETTMVLQSVCDDKLHFIHICTGWPGSVKEETILKDSDLNNNSGEQVRTNFPSGSFLVGDEAYCLRPWLMTPFADHGNLSTLQQRFNSACCQICQENTNVYSLLVQRFPRLVYVDMEDMQSTVATVLVCCALHNFCLDNGEEKLCDQQEAGVKIRNINSSKPEDGISSIEGESKRQCVLQCLQEL